MCDALSVILMDAFDVVILLNRPDDRGKGRFI
jgi:hypothetical protein